MAERNTLLGAVSSLFGGSSTLSSDYAKQVDLTDAEIERREWQKLIQQWAYDMAPSPGDIGQHIQAPEQQNMGPFAPSYEMAMYNQPRKWPGIASIVNLKG